MHIANKQARHLAIHGAGLSATPTGDCDLAAVLQLVKSLGYVQIDPLQVVARAHDHILWSRNQNYKPAHLERLLDQERSVFEHFCHDACVLPVDTLPYWQHQFKRQSEKLTSSTWRDNLTAAEKRQILNKITKEGQLRSNDFKSPTPTKKTIWTKPAHKKILDYLWLKGDLAVSQRINFAKYYDLAERVYPTGTTANKSRSNAQTIDWLSSHALACLVFATPTEITRFWDAYDLPTVKQWCNKGNAKLISVTVDSHDNTPSAYLASPSQIKLIKSPPKPTSRLRIVNPFDPLVRDRKRLARLFGFEYKIEIYIPAAKRQYGYYVYPLLEYDTFVGRLEIKHDRKTNQLLALNLWPEPGIDFGNSRMKKLTSEVERLGRFCGAESVIWSF